MSTTTREGLQAFLERTGIPGHGLASISTDIDHDPLAICLAHLADILVQLTNCDPHVAYKSLVWSPEMTNLVLVVPKLRLKDIKADDLADDLVQRVSSLCKISCFAVPNLPTVSAIRAFWTSNKRKDQSAVLFQGSHARAHAFAIHY
jgi:hypothetical protein